MNPVPGSVQGPRPADAADPKRPGSRRFNRCVDISVLRRGIQLDSAAYVSLLQQCGNTKAFSDGKRVHAHLIECGRDRDQFLANNLLQMYSKCGHLQEARAVFDAMEERCMFSWTIMIAGCTQNGHCREAIQLFREMELEGVKPDGVTLTSVVGAYTGAQSLKECKEIHGRIAACGFEEHDVFLANALINMYGKCGSTRDAKSVFDRMPRRNVVSWNALFTAYAQNGHYSLVLELYRSMDLKGARPTHVTFVTVLNACSSLGALAEARAVHACVIANGLESDLVVGNTLINAYGKSGSLEEARRVFDRMPQRDVVSWNAILGAYAQQGHSELVLELYGKMDANPNRVTFITVLGACSHSEAFAEGKAIHTRIAEMPELLDSDIAVRTALIGMHGRCGSLDHARALFDGTRNRDVCSWNAMLAAYAQHGHLNEVVVLFQEMGLEGVSPDGISLIILLFSCSHAGLLHEAWSYFVFMKQDHGTSPEVEHYRCMMDLLARAGRIREVEELIDSMPFEADALAWRILLAACNKAKDLDRGARAARQVVEFETGPRSAPYVLLSNMFAAGEENGGESG